MALREGVAWYVVAVVLAAAVWFCWRADRAERLARQQTENLIRKTQGLEDELREARRRARGIQGEAEVVVRAASEPAMPVEVLRVVAQESARSESQGGVAMPMNVKEERKPARATVAEDPPPMPTPRTEEAIQFKVQFNNNMRPQFSARIEEVYGEFMKSWGLGENETKRFKEAMVECWLARVRLIHVPADVRERERRKTVVELCKLLTARQLAELRYYEAEQRLVRMGLDEAGLRAVCNILLAEEKLPFEGEQGDLASWQAERRECNERILLQVRPILTEDQYEELKRRLEAEPPLDMKD